MAKPKPSKSRQVRSYLAKRRFVSPYMFVAVFGLIGMLLLLPTLAARFGGGGALPYTVTPAPNYQITQTCTGALNVAFVADVSGSIDDTELGQMKDGFQQLIDDLLPGTNTNFSLTEFATGATVMQPFTTNISALLASVNNLANGVNRNGTDWQAGLQAGYSTFSGLKSTAPRLLIIATDGDPNQPDNNTLDAAITAANTIKGANIHVLAIGLGTDPTLANLETISGTTVTTGGTDTTINTDVITTSFASLDTVLLNLIVGGCGSGTGVGSGGTGVGTDGSGKGANGSGTGSGGTGTGSTGAGSGTTAGPKPSPSSSPQPAPSPTQNPTPNPAPAPVASPSPTPNPAPTPKAIGTQVQPPAHLPSPFYDGKEFAPGSVADNLTAAAVRHGLTGWWYVVIGLVLVVGAGVAGFIIWRRRAVSKALPRPSGRGGGSTRRK